MSKALYRKYRPKSLSEVVGQEQVTDILSKAIKQNKLSHAYLFIGPRGTGKTSVARIFAHEINHFKYELEDEYLDIIEIDAASNTGVDNIRELREKAIIAPSEGKYKIYIIDEVHMLSKAAFNALLKTLEEPPEHVIFIMATTDAHKVPVTITSRSQTYTFKLADSEIMFKHLRKVADSEKIPIDDEALRIVVRRGGGSFRDSMSLLDQISTLSNKTITAKLVSEALGLPEDQQIKALLDIYGSADLANITKTLKDLLSTGVKPDILAEGIIGQILEDPKPELLPLLSKLPDVKDNNFPEAKLLLAFCGEVKAAPVIVQKTVTQSVAQPAPAQPAEPTSSTVPQPVEQPAPAPASPAISPAPSNFDFDTFISKVRESSDGLAMDLSERATYAIDGDILSIYPSNTMMKKRFERPGNLEIIRGALDGFAVSIREAGSKPSQNLDSPVSAKPSPKDPTISQISDIMGAVQEVTNHGGDPF